MSNRNLLRSASYCLSAALLLAVATSGDTFAAKPDKTKGKAPLQLETYKSFVVGGERVTHPDGSVGLAGHLYRGLYSPQSGQETPANRHDALKYLWDDISTKSER